MNCLPSVICLVLTTPLALASNGITLRTVFRTGDAVPDRPGLIFSGIGGTAAIGEDGTVLAVALVNGDGVGTNNNTLVAESGGVLSVIGRETDPIPSLPGWQYRAASINTAGFFDLVAAADGQIGFVPEMFDSNAGSFGLNGVFAGPVGATMPTLYETGPAPGFPGLEFSGYLPRYVLRENQQTALVGVVIGAGAIWFGVPGNMTAALQTGLQAPGLPIGINISSIASESLRMDGSGDILFHVTLLLGNGVNQDNRTLLYLGPPANVGVLAREGEPVPGLPGAVFTNFVTDSTRMNSAGAICFGARVSGGGTDEAIISGGSGSFFALARDGQPYPDNPALLLDRVARSGLDMNGNGRVAFECKLTGAPFTTDSAILIGDPGGLETVLREGDPLPGGGVAPDLTSNAAFWTFNDRDQFAFVMTVDGEQVAYATRPNGELVKLASTGEHLTPDDGPPGMVAAITFDFGARSTDMGQTAIFNSGGELVFPIRFVGTDGQGVLVFDIDDPCPADLAPPFGLLDLSDINAFVDGFVGQTPNGDLDGNGLWDLADVNIFVGSFLAGCP